MMAFLDEKGHVLLTYSLLSKQVLLRQANYTIVQSLQC